jgi:hypothetical protein
LVEVAQVIKAWEMQIKRKHALSQSLLRLKNVNNSLKGWSINLRGSNYIRKKDIIGNLRDLEILE